jgi:hypothetical protein
MMPLSAPDAHAHGRICVVEVNAIMTLHYQSLMRRAPT